jgi:hypothetical protein
MINPSDFTRFQKKNLSDATIKDRYFDNNQFCAPDYEVTNYLMNYDFGVPIITAFPITNRIETTKKIFKIVRQLEVQVKKEYDEIQPLYDSCRNDDEEKNLYEAMKDRVDDFIKMRNILWSFYVMFN